MTHNARLISMLNQQIQWLEIQRANIHVHGIVPAPPKGPFFTDEFDTAMFQLNVSVTEKLDTEINKMQEGIRAALNLTESAEPLIADL